MKELTQREYEIEIADMARDITIEALENDCDIMDVLHEWIDGHQYVIYTYYNDFVLRFSDNAEYMFDEFGPVENVDNWGTLKAQGAYWAMYADVSQHDNFRNPEDIDKTCSGCFEECELIATDHGPMFACNDEDTGCGAMFDPLEI